MGRLQHPDLPAWHTVTVGSDHQTRERPRHVFFNRLRHAGGGFAGADNHAPSLGPGRQERRHQDQWICRRHGGIEQKWEERLAHWLMLTK